MIWSQLIFWLTLSAGLKCVTLVYPEQCQQKQPKRRNYSLCRAISTLSMPRVSTGAPTNARIGLRSTSIKWPIIWAVGTSTRRESLPQRSWLAGTELLRFACTRKIITRPSMFGLSESFSQSWFTVRLDMWRIKTSTRKIGTFSMVQAVTHYLQINSWRYRPTTNLWKYLKRTQI